MCFHLSDYIFTTALSVVIFSSRPFFYHKEGCESISRPQVVFCCNKRGVYSFFFSALYTLLKRKQVHLITSMSRVAAIDYETTIFTLKPDNLGPNRATLLHARTTNNNQTRIYKAILYLHGYIDYYFQ